MKGCLLSTAHCLLFLPGNREIWVICGLIRVRVFPADCSPPTAFCFYLWNLRNLRINEAGLSCLLPSAYCRLFLWWRRRESNPDPKVNAEGIYMLSCFSFRVSLAARAIFAHFQLSEAARRWNGLVRL